jgi:hypothetical protein
MVPRCFRAAFALLCGLTFLLLPGCSGAIKTEFVSVQRAVYHYSKEKDQWTLEIVGTLEDGKKSNLTVTVTDKQAEALQSVEVKLKDGKTVTVTPSRDPIPYQTQ